MRLGLLGLLASGLLPGLACRDGDDATPVAVDLDEPQIVSRHPLVVGVGPRWRLADGGDALQVQNFGTLWLRLGAVGDSMAKEPLRIRLAPADGADTDETSTVQVTASWDGEALTPQAVPMGEIEVPANLLSEGIHRLDIERRNQADSAAAGGRLLLREVEVSRGDAGVALGVESLLDATRVGEMVEFGGTGVDGKVFRRGWMFLGAGRGRVSLDVSKSDSSGRRTTREAVVWTALLENLGDAAVSVRVRGGAGDDRYDLAPGDSRRVRVADEPLRQVELDVRGPETLRLLVGEPYATAAGRSEAPPIILISLDTTRRDALSPYGAPADRTPHLQELADAATVYDAAYATAPWTLPSHASMFTGLLPSRHGAGVHDAVLRPDLDTLAEQLADDGYFAAGFAGGYLMSYRFGVGQGFHVYRDPDGFETPGDRLVDHVEAWLGEIHGDSHPPFLFVNFFDPHWKFQPPPDLAERFGLDELAAALDDEPAAPLWRQALAGSGDAWRRIYQSEVAIGDAGRAYLQAAYAAEVAGLDRHFGRLLDLLRSRGWFEPALIVVVADHGELLAEDGRFIGHGFRLDDELVQIPLIVKWPGQTRGDRVDHLASQIDLFPTLLSVARGEAPEPAPPGPGEATDLRSLPRQEWILAEEHSSSVHPLVGQRLVAKHLMRVQEEDFHQIVWPGGTECGRRGDDGWRVAECTKDGADLVQWLARWLHWIDTQPASGVEMDEEEAEALRALGYL